MHTNNPHNPIYRALVTYSSATTGEIRIKIPSLIGAEAEVSVSYIGRDKQSGVWYVPTIGEQIIVTADDHNLTNVFWLQTDPGVLTAVEGFYGAFSDYTDQYSGGSSTLAGAVANQAAPMRFTTTDESNGVSILDSSKILFAHPGVYNIQWSGQFENTDNAPHDVSVWLRKNGGPTGVVGSNGKISMSARKNATEFAHTLSGWNFVFTVVAGDYYEFMWSTNSTTVSIQTYPISVVPDRPSTASLVLTVTPVSKIQIGIPVPGTTPGTGGAEYLNELSDVTLTSPTTNQILTFNGTQWVNSSAPGLVKLWTSAFSGSTEVAVDNIFTSTYSNYKILTNITGGTLGRQLAIKLRSGGVSTTTNIYCQGGFNLNGSSSGITQTLVQIPTSPGWSYLGDIGSGCDNSTELFYPQVSGQETTIMHFNVVKPTGSIINQSKQVFGYIESTLSFDGITFFPGNGGAYPNGTMSGDITIYGYNK